MKEKKEMGLLNICCVKIASVIKGKDPKDLEIIMKYEGSIDEINSKFCKN